MASNFRRVEQLQRRVQKGEFLQYFNKLSKLDAKELSQGLLNNDFGIIGYVLVKNLNSYGRSLEPLINSAYDSQMEQISEQILEETIDDVESEIDEAIEEEDYDSLKRLAKELQKEIPLQLSSRSEEIQKKINEILIKIRVPRPFRAYASEIATKRNFQINETTRASAYYRWSNNKPALVIFNNGKIASWKNITRKDYSQFKKQAKVPKVRYSPTFKKRINSEPEISVRTGQGLSPKERLFIESRKDKNVAEIYQDYLKSFGKARTKADLLKRIRI